MPEKSDKRSGFRQSQNALAGMQNVGASPRSFLKGAEDILGINYRLSEGVNPSYYDEEEEQILNSNNYIEKLIESLESAADETESQ